MKAGFSRDWKEDQVECKDLLLAWTHQLTCRVSDCFPPKGDDEMTHTAGHVQMNAGPSNPVLISFQLPSEKRPAQSEGECQMLSEPSCSVVCLTLCGPLDCSQPSSSVHGTFQARILEQVAISYSRGSSQTRNQTGTFYIGGKILYH